jgi:hypothetical protein
VVVELQVVQVYLRDLEDLELEVMHHLWVQEHQERYILVVVALADQVLVINQQDLVVQV